MRTIIVGVGNPILTDDSVGIKVARMVEEKIDRLHDVEVSELHAGGIRLMEALVGYDRAIIIDSIITDNGKPGTIYSLSPEDIMMSRHVSCAHDTYLYDALELGRLVGLALPHDIRIWAIEVENTKTVSEDLTDNVRKAVPIVADEIISAFMAQNIQT